MKPARKSNIIKFLEAYNRFFTEQETQDYKNVEILFLTKDESERRIIAGKKESIIVGILITVALPKLLLFFTFHDICVDFEYIVTILGYCNF